ncbi:Bug family tripartite tricarboxylate transporter substrate binding protein [Jannaschia seohaensis]|uniref:Tripartite-type tricarboxylate transporter receptor subunit TctC n=1 Tax=Jannaschia seohaensis TaxID=475081 RepID=A0A2Y9AB74_9RHOB|nr:tripartite tricarboxylate transporter substrate-binding protein [Jannaschia seohaensis]PWJ20806.1 tripartite-type tricarboxylate transporter receptor subunit TctC [Jannaschia seohaensis]SSA41216.1 Tripartite-type tricarboxylate transporter, receptor component TctC [Jannaschia seohaensis]
MKKFLALGALALGYSIAATASLAEDWTPPGPITMHIAFPPGGGSDSQGRLIAEELETRYGWTITPQNTPGKAGLIMAKEMQGAPTDGTVFGLGISEALDYGMADGTAGMTPDDVTPIVTTTLAEVAFVVPASKGWKTFDDFVAAAMAGEPMRVGAITPKIADVTYLMGKEAGIEMNITMVQGGRGMLNALYAGDLDAGFVAGAHSRGVEAGELVELVSGMSRPLSLTPDAPLLADLGVPFNLDIYFMYFGPKDMDGAAQAKLAQSISEIVLDDTTKAGALLEANFGGAEAISGEALQAFIDASFVSAKDLMQAASE